MSGLDRIHEIRICLSNLQFVLGEFAFIRGVEKELKQEITRLRELVLEFEEVILLDIANFRGVEDWNTE